jgi:hypothetical protein
LAVGFCQAVTASTKLRLSAATETGCSASRRIEIKLAAMS